MKSPLFAMFLAPLLASAALAAQQAPEEETAKAAPAEQAGDKVDAADGVEDEAKDAAPAAKPEDERICRHVRLDMSSRRKTKVCRTVEEWRELNNIR